MLFLAITLPAFITGYAIRRGSICAVVAARALVVDGRSARMRAFGLAAAAAGSVIVPLNWLAPDAVMLSGGYPVTWSIIVAGAAFGLGARVNNACALGTLAHLTGGRTEYALTVAGMVVGAAGTVSFLPAVIDCPSASSLSEPGVVSIAVLATFAGIVVLTVTIRRRPRLGGLALL